jgi:hypothetical protein
MCLPASTTLNDFFKAKDANGNYTRLMGAFSAYFCLQDIFRTSSSTKALRLCELKSAVPLAMMLISPYSRTSIHSMILRKQVMQM